MGRLSMRGWGRRLRRCLRARSRTSRRQLSAEWSAAHEGLGRLSVYRSCRLVAVFVAGVCLILKQAHCSKASFVFVRSLDRAAWISLAECVAFGMSSLVG